jgi:hypothetical protein
MDNIPGSSISGFEIHVMVFIVTHFAFDCFCSCDFLLKDNSSLLLKQFKCCKGNVNCLSSCLLFRIPFVGRHSILSPTCLPALGVILIKMMMETGRGSPPPPPQLPFNQPNHTLFFLFLFDFHILYTFTPIHSY